MTSLGGISVINCMYIVDALCLEPTNFTMWFTDHSYDRGRYLYGWSISPWPLHTLQSLPVYADLGMHQSQGSLQTTTWWIIADCLLSHNDAISRFTGRIPFMKIDSHFMRT